jgi:hypothetical protein
VSEQVVVQRDCSCCEGTGLTPGGIECRCPDVVQLEADLERAREREAEERQGRHLAEDEREEWKRREKAAREQWEAADALAWSLFGQTMAITYALVLNAMAAAREIEGEK